MDVLENFLIYHNVTQHNEEVNININTLSFKDSDDVTICCIRYDTSCPSTISIESLKTKDYDVALILLIDYFGLLNQDATHPPFLYITVQEFEVKNFYRYGFRVSSSDDTFEALNAYGRRVDSGYHEFSRALQAYITSPTDELANEIVSLKFYSTFYALAHRNKFRGQKSEEELTLDEAIPHVQFFKSYNTILQSNEKVSLPSSLHMEYHYKDIDKILKKYTKTKTLYDAMFDELSSLSSGQEEDEKEMSTTAPKSTLDDDNQNELNEGEVVVDDTKIFRVSQKRPSSSHEDFSAYQQQMTHERELSILEFIKHQIIENRVMMSQILDRIRELEQQIKKLTPQKITPLERKEVQQSVRDSRTEIVESKKGDSKSPSKNESKKLTPKLIQKKNEKDLEEFNEQRKTERNARLERRAKRKVQQEEEAQKEIERKALDTARISQLKSQGLLR